MERSFLRVGRRDIRELKGRRCGATLFKRKSGLVLSNMH